MPPREPGSSVDPLDDARGRDQAASNASTPECRLAVAARRSTPSRQRRRLDRLLLASLSASLSASLFVSLLAGLLASLLAGCVYLPRAGLGPENDLPTASGTGRVCAAIGGCTAVDQPTATPQRGHLVWDPRAALDWRLAMIDGAESSIDLQYFVWKDRSGDLLLLRLLAAADRGVRVRLLIDDIHTAGQSSLLRTIDTHPRIAVRVFNPFQLRLGGRLWLTRVLEFSIDGNRLNHRMHNKLMVTDQAVALLGGRNIGDEYFGLSRHADFFDADIALGGEVVGELSAGFDQYWHSRWVYGVDQLLDLLPVRSSLERLRRRMERRLDRRAQFRALLEPVDWGAVLGQLRDGRPIEHAQVLIDRPELGWFASPDSSVAPLTAVGAAVQREALVVSPYFVLTSGLRALVADYAARGVDVTLITNSLGSTDVTLAHAVYEHDRRALLQAGVGLHEFRADARRQGKRTALAADRHVLHGKFFVLDRERVYVGSLNLDPRSLRKNTELGVVLTSPSLAADLAALFDTLRDPGAAWRVTLEDGGGYRWTSAEQSVVRPPAADARQRGSWLRRVMNALYRWLPVSSQV